MRYQWEKKTFAVRIGRNKQWFAELPYLRYGITCYITGTGKDANSAIEDCKKQFRRLLRVPRLESLAKD